MDEADVEYMIEACVEAADDDDPRLTPWEVEFIGSVKDANETFHLTPLQIEKLEEIHAKIADPG
jgi:hypothetical protein